MSGAATGGQINSVLQQVKQMVPGNTAEDGETQLSILCFAFVAACRSCGVPVEVAMDQVSAAFALKFDLVPLPSPPSA
jgi:hypothetical protein